MKPLSRKALLPFNIGLLKPTTDQLKTIRQVTALDIFDGPGGNFHEDGLFSITTFGRLGDPIRDRRFGYIDLKVNILHPVIYSRLIRLKGFYDDVLAGREYAKWNPEINDFEKSNELEGKTGYHFFLSHWHELKPAKTGSSIRDVRINLIDKYRDEALMNKLLVLPAGLRDVDIDGTGRPSMDEVNELYQGVLMLVRNFPDKPTQDEWGIYDRTRYGLTLKLLAIYEHFERLISGKKGFVQARYASRRVFNGTRNVISSLDTSTHDLDAPNRPRFNDAVVGIYQAAKSVLPRALYCLKTGIVGEIFSGGGTVALVEPKTFQRAWVSLSVDEMDRWTTEEGLEKVVNELELTEKRHQPVMVDTCYLALVYLDDQQNYRVFRCLEDLPEHLDKKFVRPITYIELIYLSGLAMWNTNSAFVTRYPVENIFSSYPSKFYVKTTIVGELRYPLNDSWERDESLPLALEYPKLDTNKAPVYFNSTALSPAKLARLGADFDGDMVSFNAVYSKEAIEESDKFFKTRRAYIQPGGGLASSVNVHTLGLVLSFMTR